MALCLRVATRERAQLAGHFVAESPDPIVSIRRQSATVTTASQPLQNLGLVLSLFELPLQLIRA